MSNTSNYSYPKKLEITALDMIDRDIKRVEDKVEKNETTIIAQAGLIARNEGRIEMLSKCCRNGGYLQSEIDELLEGKVDKQEGYSLIPEEYLQQIGELKKAVALQKEYIDELRERNAWLGAELEKKANNSIPEKHDLQLNEGLEKMNSAEYYKTDFGLVIVSFKVRCTTEFPAGDLILSVMPEGLRPSHHVHGVATNVSLKGEATMAIWINPGGSICAKMPEGQTLATGQGVSGFLSYFVSQ